MKRSFYLTRFNFMNEFDYPGPPLRSSWNATRMLIRGRLTDKKIEQYRKQGWYSEAFREARREFMAKKSAGKINRTGSFVVSGDRMIYNPI